MICCDEIKITELIVSNKIEDINDYWFHSNKRFNYKDAAIDMRSFTAYRSRFRLNKFLLRLHFKGSYADYDRLNLNDLTELEQLKIDLDIPSDITQKVVGIDLPNLKILEIGHHHYSPDPRHFNLMTPKLEMLKCYDMESINFYYRNTINHLEVVFYNRVALTLNNIEHLNVKWGLLPNQHILSAYPKLTTIICNKFDYNSEDDVEDSMNTLCHFVEQKHKRPELKTYFQSVELVDCDKIEEYESAASILSFQINNYNSLCDNIAFDSEVDYNELMRLVNGTLPDDFYQKYFNIPSVSVEGKIKSKEHLVQFLKKLDYLKLLRLEETRLDQTFYDGLNVITRLTELYIIEKGRSNINYDFLLKLEILETFSTDRDSPEFFNLTLALFRQLKYFRWICFYFGNEFISVDKNENLYEFSRYKDTSSGIRKKLFEKRRMGLDQLIRLIDAYKVFRSNSRIEYDPSFQWVE